MVKVVIHYSKFAANVIVRETVASTLVNIKTIRFLRVQSQATRPLQGRCLRDSQQQIHCWNILCVFTRTSSIRSKNAANLRQWITGLILLLIVQSFLMVLLFGPNSTKPWPKPSTIFWSMCLFRPAGNRSFIHAPSNSLKSSNLSLRAARPQQPPGTKRPLKRTSPKSHLSNWSGTRLWWSLLTAVCTICWKVESSEQVT